MISRTKPRTAGRVQEGDDAARNSAPDRDRARRCATGDDCRRDIESRCRRAATTPSAIFVALVRRARSRRRGNRGAVVERDGPLRFLRQAAIEPLGGGRASAFGDMDAAAGAKLLGDGRAIQRRSSSSGTSLRQGPIIGSCPRAATAHQCGILASSASASPPCARTPAPSRFRS